MAEFATTATHDGRAVPMPKVDTATCSDDEFEKVRLGYTSRPWNVSTPEQDHADFRARILADARASAAPSEDAIRKEQREAFVAGAYWMDENKEATVKALNDECERRYAPRPVYAAPVRLSDGSTFGQVGPDWFALHTVHSGCYHVSSTKPSAEWHAYREFSPKDGALVLAVLDGAEATR